MSCLRATTKAFEGRSLKESEGESARMKSSSSLMSSIFAVLHAASYKAMASTLRKNLYDGCTRP